MKKKKETEKKKTDTSGFSRDNRFIDLKTNVSARHSMIHNIPVFKSLFEKWAAVRTVCQN
jgi:hypothetical protein